jgi:hypothetical protein
MDEGLQESIRRAARFYADRQGIEDPGFRRDICRAYAAGALHYLDLARWKRRYTANSDVGQRTKEAVGSRKKA